MDITKYLSKDCILFIQDTHDRGRVLELLIEAAHAAGKVKDKLRFAEAVAARELIVSTGIGLGVAVPHAKVKSIDSFFICLGIVEKGVDWESIDGQPVHIVFLIGGPDDNQKEYLHILAQIVQVVKNAEKREKLRNSRTTEHVLSLLLS
ncbi:MAG: PTS sugar transporter subunit IIA [Spirochaetes bacterium]|nr:PTS sugar transporter subunit IIA [Spirochaetota bacterium]